MTFDIKTEPPSTDFNYSIAGSKEQEFVEDRHYYQEQMVNLPEDSPRHGALKAEVRGYGNVLDIIQKKKRKTNQ